MTMPSTAPPPTVVDLYLRLSHAMWKRVPPGVRDRRMVRRYGAFLHRLVCARAQRRQYFGTFFLRNRPALEQVRRLIATKPQGASLRIAVLGCSIGAEVYSVLWAIRSARPDLQVRLDAVDISAEIVGVAAKAVYTPASSGLVGSSIFERLSETERREIFDWDGDTASVKAWLREGIGWHVGDAGDPSLVHELGPQDLVLASNFLCHMEPAAAERCLRNLAGLARRGGHLLIVGVDLEVRAKVARELGWEPVLDLIREIHDGDPSVRRDWPWAWWGLEPLDDRRPDWQARYAVVYRV